MIVIMYLIQIALTQVYTMDNKRRLQYAPCTTRATVLGREGGGVNRLQVFIAQPMHVLQLLLVS